MRKFGVLAVVVVGVLAVPGAAMANHGSNCTYAATPAGPTTVYTPLPTIPGSDPGSDAAVYLHNTPNQSGMSGDADTAAGACVNNTSTQPQGGTVEVGTGSSVGGGGDGTYAIVDGDNQNDVTGQDDGYFGLSNYENEPATPADSPCPTATPDNANNSGTNSGQCHGPDGGPYQDAVPGGTPDFACGNTSGNTWDNSIRDGCSIP